MDLFNPQHTDCIWLVSANLQLNREKCSSRVTSGVRFSNVVPTRRWKILRTWIIQYDLCQTHYVDPMAGIFNERVNCCLSFNLAFPSVQYVSLRWTGPQGASKSQGVWRKGTGQISALWQFSTSFIFYKIMSIGFHCLNQAEHRHLN